MLMSDYGYAATRHSISLPALASAQACEENQIDLAAVGDFQSVGIGPLSSWPVASPTFKKQVAAN